MPATVAPAAIGGNTARIDEPEAARCALRSRARRGATAAGVATFIADSVSTGTTVCAPAAAAPPEEGGAMAEARPERTLREALRRGAATTKYKMIAAMTKRAATATPTPRPTAETAAPPLPCGAPAPTPVVLTKEGETVLEADSVAAPVDDAVADDAAAADIAAEEVGDAAELDGDDVGTAAELVGVVDVDAAVEDVGVMEAGGGVGVGVLLFVVDGEAVAVRDGTTAVDAVGVDDTVVDGVATCAVDDGVGACAVDEPDEVDVAASVRVPEVVMDADDDVVGSAAVDAGMVNEAETDAVVVALAVAVAVAVAVAL